MFRKKYLFIFACSVDCSGKTSAVIEGNEYQLFESRVSFQDARTGCANWAGTTSAVLTSILDQTTQTCITQMLSSDGVYNPDDWSDQPDAYERGAWIGGNDMETESNWVWEDGSQMPTSQVLYLTFVWTNYITGYLTVLKKDFYYLTHSFCFHLRTKDLKIGAIRIQTITMMIKIVHLH